MAGALASHARNENRHPHNHLDTPRTAFGRNQRVGRKKHPKGSVRAYGRSLMCSFCHSRQVSLLWTDDAGAPPSNVEVLRTLGPPPMTWSGLGTTGLIRSPRRRAAGIAEALRG